MSLVYKHTKKMSFQKGEKFTSLATAGIYIVIGRNYPFITRDF